MFLGVDVVHLGTGIVVQKHEIPPWKGRPQGEGVWERTACGSYVRDRDIAKTRRGVKCQSCRRTKAYRETRDGQETSEEAG